MQYRPSILARVTPNIRAPHRDSHQISEHHTETHTKYPSTTPRPTSPIGPASPLRLPLTHPAPSHKCRGAKKAPAHADDPSQSETKPACQARRSTESPTTHPASAADNDRSMHMPPCPCGQMHPNNRNARAAHVQAQPPCPSGPRHQGTQATITPQCPSGPRTSTAAMSERLRDNHHTAMPERSMPSGPRHQDTQATFTPQGPSGPCKQTAMPDRPRSNDGGSTKDKRAEHARPQVSRVVSSPAAARAWRSTLVRDGR
jgi:hypothetical protein